MGMITAALKRSNCGSAKLIYFLPMPVRCLSKAGMLLALVFLVSSCGLTAAQQPVPEFRLPEGLRPTHYQLDLTIVRPERTDVPRRRGDQCRTERAQ